MLLLNKNIKYCWRLCAFLLAYPVAGTAQYAENHFIKYSVKDGLSDNYITGLQQDNDGYMWIATDMGLNRFDGNSFSRFYQGSEKMSLVSSNIFQLKPFGKNKLGILTNNGFQLLNTHNSEIQNYFIPGPDTFSMYQNGVQDVIKLPGENIMLSTATGVYVLDSNSRVSYRYDAYQPDDSRWKNKVFGRNIFNLGNHVFLVYTEDNGIGYYNAIEKKFHLITDTDAEFKFFQHPVSPAGNRWITSAQVNKNEFIFIEWLNDQVIYYNHASKKRVVSALPIHVTSVLSWESKIVFLDNNNFAVNAGQKGFYTFTLEAGTGKIIFSPIKHLPSYKITHLFQDKDKRLWAGTSQGLLKQKLAPPVLQMIPVPAAEKDTITGGITSIYRHKNKIYAGRFSRRFGLLIIDTTFMQVQKQVALFGNDNMWNEIRSIQMYHPDTLWLGTNAGIIWFDTKTERYGRVTDHNNESALQNFPAMLAPAHANGYAWMCKVLGGVVVKYHIASRQFTYYTLFTKPKLPFSKVKNITYDSYGDVWIGGHGMARWNNDKQAFDTLIKIYGGINKLNDDILTLGADDAGSLWLHNAYNDLLQYRIREKKFKAYTTNEGLPPGEIRSFSPVINEQLWINNQTALYVFNTRTKKIKIYDHNDGLPDDRPSSRQMYVDDATGFIYLLLNQSMVKFPQKFADKPETGSDLIIQELQVNNSKSFYHPSGKIKLDAHENNLALHFTVIDFEEHDNYKFSYMLNKQDGWTALDHQRNINLTGLSPGNYDVQVKAVSKSGHVKTVSLSFAISPPFWKTPLFLAALGLLLAFSGFMLYRRRIKQIQQKANLDKLLAQTEMKALHAQMNPHFIFNSLNSIREMILQNDNNEASHFLGKFAKLIRITLDQSGKSYISLYHTIDYLKRYMEIEQIRNSFFTYQVITDEALDINDTFLPPMLIQPFIENALWHGIKADNKKIHVKLQFKGINNQLCCIVEDNGIGIEDSLKIKETEAPVNMSVGIENIKNRIKLLNEKYNLDSSITIMDKRNIKGAETGGTIVTLLLPIQTHYDE